MKTKTKTMRNALVLLSIFSAAMAASGIAGCADSVDPQAVREEPVYITGSNIARKQHSGEVSVMSGEAYERARSSVTPSIPQVPGGGH